MPAPSRHDTHPLFADATSATVRLVVYVVLAICLMVADHRGAYLERVRDGIDLALEPLRWLAMAPIHGTRRAAALLVSQHELLGERARLEQELLMIHVQLNRFAEIEAENARLRALLGAVAREDLRAQAVDLLALNLDPQSHRMMLAAGRRDGVFEGQVLVDGDGVVGQVDRVGVMRSVAVLISDPDHALPVKVVRTGARLIAHGSGRTDRLRVPNVLDGQLQPGDLLVTSGLGGRFPAGTPVAVVEDLSADGERGFATALARPTAALDRAAQVLLLWPSGDVLEELP